MRERRRCATPPSADPGPFDLRRGQLLGGDVELEEHRSAVVVPVLSFEPTINRRLLRVGACENGDMPAGKRHRFEQSAVRQKLVGGGSASGRDQFVFQSIALVPRTPSLARSPMRSLLPNRRMGRVPSSAMGSWKVIELISAMATGRCTRSFRSQRKSAAAVLPGFMFDFSYNRAWLKINGVSWPMATSRMPRLNKYPLATMLPFGSLDSIKSKRMRGRLLI